MGVDYRYVVSLFPSLGMNSAFVGGSANHLAFSQAGLALYGKFYVTRIDEPRRPDNLIVFVSARCEQQIALPVLGRPDGFFRVDAPWFTQRNWQAVYDPEAAYPGVNSGFVSCRYAKKAISAQFDGHAGLLGWDQLQDMRRWADGATRADWQLGTR
jgi:hypothetical protein